jgi:AcrR family transcriptional regulator
VSCVAENSRGEQTRQKLLAQAIERFAAVGFQAASVAEICRMVGMSSTATYPYFASKEDLFAAAIDADAEGLIHDALGDVIAGEFTGDWIGIFTRLLGALDQHPLARRVLAGDEGRGAERLLVLPAEAALRQGLTAALANGQTNDTIRTDVDPETIATGLETLVIALLIATLQTGGAAHPERLNGVIAVLDAAIH